MKAIRFILITALMASATAVLAVDASPVELKWSPVRGAGGYRVEVKPEDGPILRRTVAASRLSMRLKPGAYELRITVLNKFGRAAADSGWRPLRVRLAVKPAVAAVRRERPRKRDGGSRIRIRGKNFVKQTTVVLRGPDGVEHEFDARLVDGDEIALVVRDDLPRGRYDVIVKNPGVDPVVQPSALAFRGRRSTGGSAGGPSRPEVKPTQAVWRSALIPGWGQFLRGDTYKAALMTAGYLLPLALVSDARHQYLRADRDVRTQEVAGALVFLDTNLGTEVGAISFLLADTVRAARTQEANRFRLATGLAAAFYAYNIADSYFLDELNEPETPAQTLWRSAVLPGWGQGARGDSLKGALLLGGTVLGTALMLDSRNDYNRDIRERDTLNIISLLVPFQESLLAANLWLIQNSNAAVKRVRRSAWNYQGASLALAAIYVYNLLMPGSISKMAMSPP